MDAVEAKEAVARMMAGQDWTADTWRCTGLENFSQWKRYEGSMKILEKEAVVEQPLGMKSLRKRRQS